MYFYPRPPGGGRLGASKLSRTTAGFLSTPSGWRATVEEIINDSATPWISIHALRVEGDRRLCDRQFLIFQFLSTPSGWRATSTRAEAVRAKKNFYPRPPGGGRLVPDTVLYNAMIFLSTPSGWRATKSIHTNGGNQNISIHALRVEGDRMRRRPDEKPKKFLSTPSGWRATAKTDKVFVCFCAKGRRICLFKTRKEKNLPVAF